MTSLLTSLLTLPNWTWPGLISVRRGGSLPGEACRALVWWLMFYEVCSGFCDHSSLIRSNSLMHVRDRVKHHDRRAAVLAPPAAVVVCH